MNCEELKAEEGEVSAHGAVIPTLGKRSKRRDKAEVNDAEEINAMENSSDLFTKNLRGPLFAKHAAVYSSDS